MDGIRDSGEGVVHQSDVIAYVRAHFGEAFVFVNERAMRRWTRK